MSIAHYKLQKEDNREERPHATIMQNDIYNSLSCIQTDIGFGYFHSPTMIMERIKLTPTISTAEIRTGGEGGREK